MIVKMLISVMILQCFIFCRDLFGWCLFSVWFGPPVFLSTPSVLIHLVFALTAAVPTHTCTSSLLAQLFLISSSASDHKPSVFRPVIC